MKVIRQLFGCDRRKLVPDTENPLRLKALEVSLELFCAERDRLLLLPDEEWINDVEICNRYGHMLYMIDKTSDKIAKCK